MLYSIHQRIITHMFILTFSALNCCYGAATTIEDLEKDLIEVVSKEAINKDDLVKAEELIRSLIRAGCKIGDIFIGESQDPILCFVKSVAMASYLIIRLYIPANGQSPITGKTPLHAAVENGNSDLVKCLILEGGYVNSADVHGRTPLALAHAVHHEAIERILQEEEAYNQIILEGCEITVNHTTRSLVEVDADIARENAKIAKSNIEIQRLENIALRSKDQRYPHYTAEEVQEKYKAMKESRLISLEKTRTNRLLIQLAKEKEVADEHDIELKTIEHERKIERQRARHKEKTVQLRVKEVAINERAKKRDEARRKIIKENINVLRQQRSRTGFHTQQQESADSIASEPQEVVTEAQVQKEVQKSLNFLLFSGAMIVTGLMTAFYFHHRNKSIEEKHN